MFKGCCDTPSSSFGGIEVGEIVNIHSSAGGDVGHISAWKMNTKQARQCMVAPAPVAGWSCGSRTSCSYTGCQRCSDGELLLRKNAAGMLIAPAPPP